MKPAKPKSIKIEANTETMRDRIVRLFALCVKIRGRYTLSMLIVSSLLLLYAVAINYRRNHEPAQLRFVESYAQTGVDPALDEGQTMRPVFAGMAHDSVLRLRESGSLVMAVSLSVFEDFRVNGKLPAGTAEILDGIQKRSLAPPGIEIKDGVFHSDLSDLKFRYRSDPFSFEIISSPLEGVDGPSMLFRFPLPPTGANSVMYFESSRLQALPAPFSTTEQLSAAGWAIRNWSGEALPLDEASIRELRENDTWLKSQIQK